MQSFNDFPHVFTPLKVGPLTLKNRIQFSPMVSAHADPETGKVTPGLIEFIGAQARTGVGLVTIGSTPVEFGRGRDYLGCLSVVNDYDVPLLKLLADEAHRYGAKLSCELQYAGRIADPKFLKGQKALVPWVTPDMDPDSFAEITEEQIEEVVALYQNAARRLKAAGFDMLMLHGAHGNLASAFFSQLTNQRTDAYGGSLENRMNYGLKLARSLREAVGPDMAIEFRISQNEYLPGSPTWDDIAAFVRNLEKYVDLVNLSGGLIFHPVNVRYMEPSYLEPRNLNVEGAAYIKQRVGIPVAVVGNIPDIYSAEKILAEGKADIIAMARNLLADNDLVTKAYRGRAESIRPCLHCLDCLIFPNVGTPVRCAVNPMLGRETKYRRVEKSSEKKKVMIAGGGIAGMMAAQTAVQRGHDVTLFEKSDKLGGRLHEASSLYCKDYYRKYLDWDISQTMNCGAHIIMNTEVTPELIKEEAPDALILAIGGEHMVLPIDGLAEADTITVSDADLRRKPIGHKVVFCGAGLSATECAVGLTKEGHECILIDKMPDEKLLTELMESLTITFRTTRAELGIKLYDKASIIRITSKSVTFVRDGLEITVGCDTVVTAFGLRPNNGVLEELANIIPETYIVGDANTVKNIRLANHDAFNVAVEL